MTYRARFESCLNCALIRFSYLSDFIHSDDALVKRRSLVRIQSPAHPKQQLSGYVKRKSRYGNPHIMTLTDATALITLESDTKFDNCLSCALIRFFAVSFAFFTQACVLSLQGLNLVPGIFHRLDHEVSFLSLNRGIIDVHLGAGDLISVCHIILYFVNISYDLS